MQAADESAAETTATVGPEGESADAVAGGVLETTSPAPMVHHMIKEFATVSTTVQDMQKAYHGSAWY